MGDLHIKLDPFGVIHEDVIVNILNLVHEGSDGRRDFLSVRLVSKRWKEHLDRCLCKWMSIRLTLDDFKQGSLGFKLYQRLSFDSLKLEVGGKVEALDSYFQSLSNLRTLFIWSSDNYPLLKEGSVWHLSGLKFLKIYNHLEDARCLSSLTSLESLKIKGPYEVPSNLVRLTKINFTTSPFNMQYQHVRAFTNLVSLKVKSVQAEELISAVANLPRLREIKFHEVGGDIAQREDRPLLLTKLVFPMGCFQRWLQESYMNYGFMSWVQWLVRNSIELKELHWFCGKHDFTRIKTDHLTSLTRLSFDSLKDSTFDLDKILPLTNLKRLSLGSKVNVTDEERKSIFKNLPSITRLDIQSNYP